METKKNKDDQLDKIKSKLEKLLAKAESAKEIGSLEEAEIFMQKVNSLLTEYNLTKEDIRVKTGNPKEDIVFVDIDVKAEHGWSKTDGLWMLGMYNTVSKYNYCRMVRDKSWIKEGLYLKLFGEPENIDIVRYLVSFIIAKGRQLQKERWETYRSMGGPEKKNAFKRGYFVGLCTGINIKLMAQRAQDEAKWNGVTSLVKTNEIALKEVIEEELGSISTSKSRTYTAQHGRAIGNQDGKQMELNKGISNQNTQTKTYLK